MSAEGRGRPPVSFDDPEPASPAVTLPSRRVDRAAAQAVAAQHGFNRTVTNDPAPRTSAPRIDGRSLRRTGRTAQMNVKVTEDVRVRYIALAQSRGDVSLGQLLEEGLVLLEAQR